MVRWASFEGNRRWLLGGVVACVLALVSLWLVIHYMDVQPSKSRDDNSSADSGLGILLQLAEGALARGQLVTPAGANVYEFSLSALQLQPGNTTALSRLRDSFAPACEDVERAINANQLDEAQRELALLADYDPTNYTLLLLGGKLDAQRALMVRADEARAAILQARHAEASHQ